LKTKKPGAERDDVDDHEVSRSPLLKWSWRVVAVLLVVSFVLLVFYLSPKHTSARYRGVLTVALVQLPLLLGFVSYFLPMRLFKSFPMARGTMERLRYYFPYILILAVQALIAWFQMRYVEKLLPDWDYTNVIYGIEHDVVPTIQALILHDEISWYFEWIYVWGWVIMIQGSIVMYIAMNNEKVVRMLTVGLLLNLLIAIPFYIFFPVNEVWVTNLSYGWYDPDISFATDTIGVYHQSQNSAAENVIYSYNSINNCFPSLHTSISLTIAGTLCVTKRKYAGPIAMFVAGSVVVSTIYLGIHWLVDIVAGTVLAVTVVYFLFHFDFNLRFQPGRMKKLRSPLFWENVEWKGRPWRSSKSSGDNGS